MVKWRGRRQSKNVEDGRGGGGGVGGGIILMLLRLIVSRFGIAGIVVLGVIGFGLYSVGVNPLTLLQGMPASQQASAPVDDEDSQFVRAVLASTEDVWSQIFSENGSDYPEPVLVLFSGGVSSACGYATSAVGPFYCPADRKVYLDTQFFRQLRTEFRVQGDFPGAYVIAHEVGHHVQTITGISDQVMTARKAARSETEANEWQVRMELQADCYAGVWAHRADRYADFLDDGDIEEGLAAASAIGDDTLQRNAGRRVTPDSFTHGSSAQRQRWFTTGYRSGDVAACDTFGATSL